MYHEKYGVENEKIDGLYQVVKWYEKWMKSEYLCHFSLSVCWNFWFVNIMDAKATAPSYASYTPAQERNYDVVK